VPCAGFGFDGIGEGRLGRPYSGDYPQPALSLSLEGAPQKGGSDMKQADKNNQQVSTAEFRELDITEVVAIALDKRRRTNRESSRRVVLWFRPALIPPSTGQYETTLGTVSIFSRFMNDRGAWLVEVKLPHQSGFSIKDHVKGPSQPDSSSQGQ